MANEAAIIELGPNGGKTVTRTVAEGTTISGMTLCKLADPNTASAASTTGAGGEAFAGIITMDKIAGDGSTTASFYTEGVFDLTNFATGTPATGVLVCMSGANTIRACVAADLLTGAVVGKLEEDATGSEVVRVRLISN